MADKPSGIFFSRAPSPITPLTGIRETVAFVVGELMSASAPGSAPAISTGALLTDAQITAMLPTTVLGTLADAVRGISGNSDRIKIVAYRLPLNSTPTQQITGIDYAMTVKENLDVTLSGLATGNLTNLEVATTTVNANVSALQRVANELDIVAIVAAGNLGSAVDYRTWGGNNLGGHLIGVWPQGVPSGFSSTTRIDPAAHVLGAILAGDVEHNGAHHSIHRRAVRGLTAALFDATENDYVPYNPFIDSGVMADNDSANLITLVKDFRGNVVMWGNHMMVDEDSREYHRFVHVQRGDLQILRELRARAEDLRPPRGFIGSEYFSLVQNDQEAYFGDEIDARAIQSGVMFPDPVLNTLAAQQSGIVNFKTLWTSFDGLRVVNNEIAVELPT